MKHLSLSLALCAAAFSQVSYAEPALSQANVSIQAPTSSARLNQVAAFLADQLAHNRDLLNLNDSRIAVTTFVVLPDLQTTSKVWLALEERLMNEMQLRGFKVVDYKLMNQLSVKPQGDFIYSRNVETLRKEFNLHYFLAGTVEDNADGFVINARLVSAKDNLQVSSAQAYIPGRDVARLASHYRGEDIPRQIVDKPVAYPVENNTVRLGR